MRSSVISVCCMVLLVAIGSALPVSQSAQESQIVELGPAKETLHTLDLGEPKTDNSARDKRTIGFLREYFPTLSEIIDRALQTITRYLFRIIGRLVLGGGGGGGGTGTSSETSESGSGTASSSSGGTGRRISITLPTYPPSLDDEDEEEDEEDSSPAASSNDVLGAASNTATATSASEEVKSRVARATDQEASATNEEPALDQDASAAEENRDKRFLFGLGGEGGSAGGSGNFLFDIIRGAADNTGRAAGHLYRLVAGTSQDEIPIVYPETYNNLQQKTNVSTTAGGDDKGGGGSVVVTRSGNATLTVTLNTNRAEATKKPALIAGSGTTEEAADAGGATATGAGVGYSAGAAAIETPELDAKPDDGYTSGIPGPITRLFVIANRGISNLIQDLILRLAQTSERVVNFKARLITSII